MYRTCTGDARKTLFGDSPPSLLVMWCKTVRRLNLDQSVPRLITPTNQNEAVELRLFGQRGCRTMRSDRRNSFGPALTAGTLLPACTPCELSTSQRGGDARLFFRCRGRLEEAVLCLQKEHQHTQVSRGEARLEAIAIGRRTWRMGSC